MLPKTLKKFRNNIAALSQMPQEKNSLKTRSVSSLADFNSMTKRQFTTLTNAVQENSLKI